MAHRPELHRSESPTGSSGTLLTGAPSRLGIGASSGQSSKSGGTFPVGRFADGQLLQLQVTLLVVGRLPRVVIGKEGLVLAKRLEAEDYGLADYFGETGGAPPFSGRVCLQDVLRRGGWGITESVLSMDAGASSTASVTPRATAEHPRRLWRRAACAARRCRRRKPSRRCSLVRSERDEDLDGGDDRHGNGKYTASADCLGADINADILRWPGRCSPPCR